MCRCCASGSGSTCRTPSRSVGSGRGRPATMWAMALTRLALRQRWLPVLGVLFGAPICAEFLQAYLPSTGDAGVMLASLGILAPLYGGAALLIREVAVRRGLGWPAVLLLAGAFGVAMPGLVDLSLFTEHLDDFAYWDDLR